MIPLILFNLPEVKAELKRLQIPFTLKNRNKISLCTLSFPLAPSFKLSWIPFLHYFLFSTICLKLFNSLCMDQTKPSLLLWNKKWKKNLHKSKHTQLTEVGFANSLVHSLALGKISTYTTDRFLLQIDQSKISVKLHFQSSFHSGYSSV